MSQRKANDGNQCVAVDINNKLIWKLWLMWIMRSCMVSILGYNPVQLWLKVTWDFNLNLLTRMHWFVQFNAVVPCQVIQFQSPVIWRLLPCCFFVVAAPAAAAPAPMLLPLLMPLLLPLMCTIHQSCPRGHFSWTRPDPTRPAIADKKSDPTRPDSTRGPSLPPYVHSLIE